MALWPRSGPRHSPIAAVVLTNADLDHVAGLLSLRERQPFKLLALPPVHAALAASPVFNVLAGNVVERVHARQGEMYDTSPGLKATLFPVPGKVPLYAESEEPTIGTDEGETAGILVEAGSSRLAYVPGCAALTPGLRKRLEAADVVLFDGTLFTDDEMIREGVGTKTGRLMGHVPITGDGGSLDKLRALPARTRIYVHINNTNPILIEGSPERRIVDEAGLAIARDGMEVPL